MEAKVLTEDLMEVTVSTNIKVSMELKVPTEVRTNTGVKVNMADGIKVKADMTK